MAEMKATGQEPEILFWVGCSGSYDDRAKRITASFAKILNNLGIVWTILGTEESCTGDPAKRAGNEFLFQMQAVTNIEVMNAYGIKKVVTACPHCFNTLKNEYPGLGGQYEVVHHTQFLKSLLEDGRLTVEGGKFKGKRITFHDPCYLGRANNVYEAPRELIRKLEAELVEMKSHSQIDIAAHPSQGGHVETTEQKAHGILTDLGIERAKPPCRAFRVQMAEISHYQIVFARTEDIAPELHLDLALCRHIR